MEKDVVCGMQVDPAKAAGSSVHAGKTDYFCSKGCKVKFDAHPEQYLGAAPALPWEHIYGVTTFELG